MILRKGMWVNYKGKVGILIPEARDQGGLTVHLVNKGGETVEVVRDLSPADLSQAALNDIPESRRPTEVLARRLGYL
jgi:hypothetical protein